MRYFVSFALTDRMGPWQEPRQSFISRGDEFLGGKYNFLADSIRDAQAKANALLFDIWKNDCPDIIRIFEIPAVQEHPEFGNL